MQYAEDQQRKRHQPGENMRAGKCGVSTSALSRTYVLTGTSDFPAALILNLLVPTGDNMMVPKPNCV